MCTKKAACVCFSLKLVLLVLSAIALFFLLSDSTPAPCFEDRERQPVVPLSKPAEMLLLAEVEKVNDEIRRDEEAESVVFQYRFLFLGSLLAGVFSLAYSSIKKGESKLRPGTVMNSPYTVLFFALSFFISILLDARIRSLAANTYFISHWILWHAEPALMSSVSCDQFNTINIPLGYETWLASLRGENGEWLFASLAEWFAVHAMSCVLYLLFLGQLLIGSSKNGREPEWFWSAMGGLALASFGLLAFALSAHVAPGDVQVASTPTGSWWSWREYPFMWRILPLVAIHVIFVIILICFRFRKDAPAGS